MKETLVIYDRNKAYGEHLAFRLNGMEDFPYQVSVFSDPETLAGFFHDREVKLFLLKREDDVDLPCPPETVKLYLTDIPGYAKIDRTPAVYLYQPLHKLAEELQKRAKETEVKKMPEPGETSRVKYLGISTPVGRCGATGFALTLGQLLSQNGRVLYVSFEVCSGFSGLFEEGLDRDLADLLYACETGASGEQLLTGTFAFHGLTIVPPVRTPEDIMKTRPEDFRSAVERLAEGGGFDIVILDLGKDLRYTEEFLPLLRRLYIPTKKDGLSEVKMKEFYDWLERLDPEIRKRTEELILPFQPNFAVGKTYLEQLLWSDQGSYVRNLLGSMS